ncbi:MAG TPA: S8 family peptidase [Acidimicrobiia bacterium]|nr:S8 family peptidase [Acidimicrobiia bacterium]
MGTIALPSLREHAVRARLVIMALVAALLLASSGGTLQASRNLAESLQVVVQKVQFGDPRPERAVNELGGSVERQLPIVDGFSASIPADRIEELRTVPGVANITVNRTVHVSGQIGEGSGTASAVFTDAIRASKTWGQGYTGQGINVALIDTGVNATGDLAGKVLHAEDFTPEQNNVDTYGHGTFVGGLIAGQGTASNGGVKGVAPGANLVSVKIAGADGSTDLVRLLAALEWVVTFKDAYGIRVLNLSLGTDSTQSYLTDPLDFAIERTWNAGIVVVVAAGNRGTAPGTISKPGDDPLVITAGAVDDRTTSAISDDTLASFSGVGPTAADGLAKPDLVAPGKSVLSVRSPGSTLDNANPAARWNTSYFRGSGTSFSSAITSGAAALVLSRTWSLNPNQVKYRLTSKARPLGGISSAAQGAGEVDAFAATMTSDLTQANQGVAPALGGGSLQASRGGWCLRGADGLCLSDADADAAIGFDPVQYFGSQWAGSQWSGSQWSGSQWAGSQWAGSQWSGSQWSGSQWSGSQWGGSQWGGSQWGGSQWGSSQWAGIEWLSLEWLGSHWM